MIWAPTIEIALDCPGWREACPAAENIAHSAAGLAVVRGTTALGREWKGPVELGITLTNTNDQRRLNREYRGVDQSTNVLAFPLWEPGTFPTPGAPVLLGDVVLALETALQEASEQNKPLADHLRHLTVHGVLHLLGYDRQVEAEA